MQELSFEKRFEHQAFKLQVEKMSREQAQECLVKLHETYLAQQQMFNGMMRDSLGIQSRPMREDGEDGRC